MALSVVFILFLGVCSSLPPLFFCLASLPLCFVAHVVFLLVLLSQFVCLLQAHCGFVTDGRSVADQARSYAVNYRDLYGHPMPVKVCECVTVCVSECVSVCVCVACVCG